MIGDIDDIRGRLRRTLPGRWFSEVAPVLDGVLAGLSAGWSSLHQLLQFVIQQSRVGTATGPFLEMAGEDFLSGGFPRRSGEDDEAYRKRLLVAFQRPRATRQAVIATAASAGYTIDVFEAARPGDTGVYNNPSCLAWSATGAWGSMQMPLECLIVARPQVDSHEDELWHNLGQAAPAGGALWIRITTGF